MQSVKWKMKDRKQDAGCRRGKPHSAFCSLRSSLRRGGRVVYCGGLENRFGFTADGGSNPSLSAMAMAGTERMKMEQMDFWTSGKLAGRFGTANPRSRR
jgi:hypothetical protein